MADHRTRMYVHVILYYDTSYAGDMCVDSIAIADMCIVADNTIGLYHVVVSNNRICTNRCEATDEITFA